MVRWIFFLLLKQRKNYVLLNFAWDWLCIKCNAVYVYNVTLSAYMFKSIVKWIFLNKDVASFVVCLHILKFKILQFKTRLAKIRIVGFSYPTLMSQVPVCFLIMPKYYFLKRNDLCREDYWLQHRMICPGSFRF